MQISEKQQFLIPEALLSMTSSLRAVLMLLLERSEETYNVTKHRNDKKKGCAVRHVI